MFDCTNNTVARVWIHMQELVAIAFLLCAFLVY